MLLAAFENSLILDARLQLGDEKNAVVVGTQSLNDLSIDVLVSDDPHPVTFSSGYTTSARRTSAANAIAARMLSPVRRGCSDRICSALSPAASLSRMSSTVMRVPATTGFPIMTLGSDVIRLWGMGPITVYRILVATGPVLRSVPNSRRSTLFDLDHHRRPQARGVVAHIALPVGRGLEVAADGLAETGV